MYKVLYKHKATASLSMIKVLEFLFPIRKILN